MRTLKSKKEGKIEKPEDKDWQEWYGKLDKKEHEKMLSQLGLDKEDIEEWDQHKVFDNLESEATGPTENPNPKKKK
ncbi:MAG: hypothetical protein PHD95_03285 [Candidatus ainarchaeum sp.]|nr:hypothetical protein [Candidatus ainarchaeum sp.]